MPPARRKPFTIACFGEALWDVLPSGLFPGGAPLNVACHLTRLGVRAMLISAVGRDFLGDETRRRVADWPATTAFIARHRRHPTGIVHASLDADGAPRYRIVRHVAWDRIEIAPALRRIPPPGALVYGSLALREAPNRAALASLCRLWPSALRVLDLNLRPPFDRGEGVRWALRHAQVIKLNDDELRRCTGLPGRTGHGLEKAARCFAAQRDIHRICVTAGPRGAGLLWDGRWFWVRGRPVVVRDTIGAGDAFLAGFLAAHLARGETPARALACACRLGEFVASRDGATPPYTIDARGRPVTPRRT